MKKKVDKRTKKYKLAQKALKKSSEGNIPKVKESVLETLHTTTSEVVEMNKDINKRDEPFRGNLEDNKEKLEPKGVGDYVEDVLKATGVKKVVEWLADGKDCGCDDRKAKLNDLGRRMGITRGINCLKEDEYKYLKDYQSRYNPKRFEKEDVLMLTNLSISLFGKRVKVCSNCNSAVIIMQNVVRELMTVVELYEKDNNL